MEYEEITQRPGCQAIAELFMPGVCNCAMEWDRGYARGILYACWLAGSINEEEHDALFMLIRTKAKV